MSIESHKIGMTKCDINKHGSEFPTDAVEILTHCND